MAQFHFAQPPPLIPAPDISQLSKEAIPSSPPHSAVLACCATWQQESKPPSRSLTPDPGQAPGPGRPAAQSSSLSAPAVISSQWQGVVGPCPRSQLCPQARCSWPDQNSLRSWDVPCCPDPWPGLTASALRPCILGEGEMPRDQQLSWRWHLSLASLAECLSHARCQGNLCPAEGGQPGPTRLPGPPGLDGVCVCVQFSTFFSWAL